MASSKVAFCGALEHARFIHCDQITASPPRGSSKRGFGLQLKEGWVQTIELYSATDTVFARSSHDFALPTLQSCRIVCLDLPSLSTLHPRLLIPVQSSEYSKSGSGRRKTTNAVQRQL